MRNLLKAAAATAALVGAMLVGSAPARADSFGISMNGGIGFSYDSGGYCDSYGCPDDFWNYPVAYCPVYFRGQWYRGPLYYSERDGEHYYWLRGGWRRDEWNDQRPGWACEGRFGPPLGIDFYLSHGFHWRNDWRDRFNREHRGNNWDHHGWDNGGRGDQDGRGDHNDRDHQNSGDWNGGRHGGDPFDNGGSGGGNGSGGHHDHGGGGSNTGSPATGGNGSTGGAPNSGTPNGATGGHNSSGGSTGTGGGTGTGGAAPTGGHGNPAGGSGAGASGAGGRSSGGGHTNTGGTGTGTGTSNPPSNGGSDGSGHHGGDHSGDPGHHTDTP